MSRPSGSTENSRPRKLRSLYVYQIRNDGTRRSGSVSLELSSLLLSRACPVRLGCRPDEISAEQGRVSEVFLSHRQLSPPASMMMYEGLQGKD